MLVIEFVAGIDSFNGSTADFLQTARYRVWRVKIRIEKHLERKESELETAIFAVA